MSLSDKFINLRVNKKLSRGELAQKLNISEDLVLAWETGEKEPSIVQLVEISKTFEVSIDSLLGTEGKKEKNAPFNPLAAFAIPGIKFNLEGSDDEDMDEDLIQEMIDITSAIDLRRKKSSKKEQ